MNRHLYRLLFNQRRGQLMAVAESAVAAGKTAGTTGNQGRPRRILRAVLRGVTFGVLIALGLAAVLPNANAQIVAYKTAPASQRPTILTASNGVPLINIQTPSAGGVSRNTYSQFDVQAEGAILNNARTNAATQLGGWVQGNPWLAKGSARVILNEIVSSNPSLLSGYLEVAGDRAQVIVANPAGVTCSGCGFLNASRATLTTGTPMVSGGNLDGYRVEGGSVRIEGAGLDASRVDVTDLIARAVEVNAGIWAHTLKVTAGTNQIDAAHTQAVPIAGQGSAPAFAIDVAALGGMYAGKITLVGTEAGVGVRNAGELGAAAGNIVITADGQLVNSGTLSAASNITLNTDAVLQNRGLISAGQTLDVQTGTLDNATTRSGDRGLEGRTVSLIAEHLNNAGGAIRADTVATITSSGTLDNGNGLITSAGTMAIRDSAPTRTLAVTNSTGTVIAGQSLAIDVASLGGDGSLLSEGDLAISLAADYTHTGQLAANGQVTVSTAGDLINHGTLESGTAMAISAESLDNQAGGEIAAPELTLVASAAHTLTNRGLIDGSDTRINAISLNNLGTGRIYGDDLAIAATTLNNDAETVGGSLESPVIAARNRLDIGVGTLNNRNGAVMFSASDLFIGGALDADDHATGQAVTVNNHAATVESLGHLAIAADAITNTNAGLVTSTVIESTQHIQEVQPEGWSHRYDVSFFPHIFNYGVEDQTYVVNGVVQGGFEDYTFYDYAGTTSATEVLSSLPGQILSGGDLILSGNLTNADSRIIAGGTLLQTGGMLNNTSTEGTRTTTYSGWAQFRDWDGNDEELEFGPHYAFSPAPVVTSFNLGIARFDANTVPTGSGTTIAAMNLSGPGQTADGAGGLFIPTTDPTAHFLIETDPRFAGYRQWLSSDYMLSQLAYDPATTQKRLGDGFYEQRLLTEQIAQLTGRRFLEGYASDEAQYRALMEAGVTVAGELQLIPGVALSEAQIAQLTSDIVWLVEKEVALADGSTQKALVPQVYVRIREGDLAPTGGLLAGENVAIDLTGDLHNQGTIAGRRVVALTAENIKNLGGRISGETIALNARQDLTIRGGTIDAGDVLQALAGRQLTIESTTRDTENSEGDAHFTRTNIDRIAALYVNNPGGTLTLAAGTDLALNAAQLQSAGSTVIDAGGNLRLGTVRIAEENDTGADAANKNRSGATAEIGTTIEGTGSILLSAANDLSARAASITSTTGALAAVAGHDLLIEAGEASEHSEITQKKKRSGTFSSKTKIQRDAFADTRAQASTFSGDTVTLQAGNNLRVLGSNVVSTNETALTAGRNLAIESATEKHTETHYKKTKESGLMGSGGVGFTIGSRMLSTDQQGTGTTAAASTVGSTSGNVVLKAGETYRQVGSDVIAPSGDIEVTAKTVDILEARETNRTTFETKMKQSGLTVAITSPIISAIQTAQQMSEAAKDTKDSRMQRLAAANVGLSAYSTYDAITRDANAAGQAGGVSKTTQTSDAAAGSTRLPRNFTRTRALPFTDLIAFLFCGVRGAVQGEFDAFFTLLARRTRFACLARLQPARSRRRVAASLRMFSIHSTRSCCD